MVYYAKLAVLILAVILITSGSVMAADNQGTGDIAGDGASLNNSNIFSLFTTTLSLNKTAFLADGTQLASGSTLPRGTEVRFLVYVDNPTAVSVADVSVQDILDAAFSYQSGSMKVDSTLASGSSEALIYSTVNAVATTLSDAVDTDVASVSGSTLNVGDETVANGQLDVPANSIWAILFRVLLQ
jgi:uncharacterized repeat protein (TIGR01451 family)